ncbi:MAG: hypothetical protein JWM43_316 [Acidobacteriaceae bacterium]|nr:hypothetical protein [Acidobacteriaceae bacterium]
MPVIQTILTLAAEPASILYMATGAAGLVYAGLFKSRAAAAKPSVAMLFCKRKSRAMLDSLNLL